VQASFLLDVNVLVAMAWPSHEAHKKAQHWFSLHANAGWATCPITQSAFVRILSNPGFSENALTPKDALHLLQANLGQARHEFWADELTLRQALGNLEQELSGHQQITDAYLLGLAVYHRAKFATLDRAVAALLPTKDMQRQFVELI